MLLAGETLFLRSSNDVAVYDERGSAVMIEGRYADDGHWAKAK